ncbi:peptidoglycan-binding domain-containing protein [Magnetospirillum sp. UT-4]|uniref:peptidoglycan-binding domain-containing protein n=1 Tax=Magnetospirillum sp. UT-4 TaxID=2681467 RepID=UPI00138237E5|nr:peptidoglycan-binding domain-containing protein [Magnetospirillum sp. UT-4]CAA7626506.1 exported hypothetical protein [Magnetospirillum sp. UT-4]
MNRTVISLAVLAVFAASPALAQQARGDIRPTIAQLEPQRDVLRAAEQRLSALGYDVTADGRFDADLRNSVLLFQSDHGLRPTGSLDLSTLAALDIDVDPAGRASAYAAPAQPQQSASAEPAQTDRRAVNTPRPQDPGIPLLRDEHMSSPQYLGQGSPLENHTGVPQTLSAYDSPADMAGLPPGYTIDDYDAPWN